MGGVAVITGASSGIGRALAIELAREGYRVGLIARRADRLEEVVARIRDEGGSADCVPAAVTGRDEIQQAMGALTERLGPIDLLVANAGIALGTDALVPAAESLEAEFRVNVFGGGHVVVISSLAAHRGLPGAAGYCASKAALTRLIEGLRPDWARAGIHATTVHPGYVRSEMTDRNRFRMPLFMETDRAARLIARAIRRKRKVYEFPWRMSLLVRHVVRHLPDRVLASLVRRDKERPEQI